MKVPISWLKEYVDITIPLEELVERLTLAGLEVAAVERIGDWWDPERIVVGEILEVRPHPNADRLVLVDVAYGGKQVEQCVTGAPNLFPYKGAGPVSLKVAFAQEGAELYDGHKEGFVKTRLKPTRIRGVPSRAMVCSEKELGLSEEHEGIMFLPDDAPVGLALSDYLGDNHDLALLTQLLEEQTQELFSDEIQATALLGLVAERWSALVAASRPLAERIYVEKPKDFVARIAGYWHASHA